VLVVAFVSTRTCGAANQNVSKEEAIEIAKENASFVPCEDIRCQQVRYVPRGIPVRGFWAVVLSEKLDERGQPTRIESFLISVSTGAVSRP
jgi:hypothetical protein